MPWQQTPDKRLIPGGKTGLNAVAVTNITPLYLKISLDAVTVSSDGSPLYIFGVENQAALTPEKRRKTSGSLKVGEKNTTFQFIKVEGNPASPTNVVVQLNGTTDPINVPNDKEQPWKRIAGYTADLHYELPPRTVKNWPNMRVGNTLDINGERYNIIAISKNEVILSAVANDKRYPIRFNPSSA
jgi:hypothetical protein